LEKLQEKYRETGNKARDRLSELYLDDVEAVTARLNKQALPRITRFLLSVDGVYETMLLEAIESGVGREPGGRGNPASHAGYGPGSTAQVVSPRSGK